MVSMQGEPVQPSDIFDLSWRRAHSTAFANVHFDWGVVQVAAVHSIITSHFIANLTEDAPMGSGGEDLQSIRVQPCSHSAGPSRIC